MGKCSLALHIPEYWSEAMEITRIGSTIDVWSLAVNAKADLRRLSYGTLPRRVDKVGTFTPRYNTTEQLPSSRASRGRITRSYWLVRKAHARRPGIAG